MSEMIDRVARRLAILDGRAPDDISGGPCHLGHWTDEGEPFWKGYVDAAVELITEMREPTAEMLKGDDDSNPALCMEFFDLHRADDTAGIWRALINRALKTDSA